MDNEERLAWNECLTLWGTLSEMPDTYTIKSVSEFKQNILRQLGIGDKEFGCPFCSKYNGTPNCPLGDCTYSIRMEGRKAPCFYTPYGTWQDGIIDGTHVQRYAKEFYGFLINKARELEKGY